MSRTYDRETKHYYRDVLTHLVETGEATFFESANVYVIKTENGTVAVRPHQIIERPVQLVIEDVVEVPVADTPERSGTSWVSASEQDEILGYFGI